MRERRFCLECGADLGDPPGPWRDEQYGWFSVIAVDPGTETGWAVGTVRPKDVREGKRMAHKMLMHVASGTVTGREKRVLRHMVDLLESWPDAILVLEDFRVRQIDMSESFLSPARINAVLSWEARRPVVYQSPGYAMATVTDDRLRDWGMWNVNEHARDAMRHLITFIRDVSGVSPNARERRKKVGWG